jgi:hypothetical protein
MHKSLQVGRMYAQCLSLKKVPNQIIRPILIREIVQNNQKTGFFCCFSLLFWGHLGILKMNQKGYPNARKWARCMAQCQNFKNKPLTKSSGPFCYEEWSKTTRQQIIYAIFHHFGAVWALPNGPKKVLKGTQVGGMYSPMFKHEKKPLNKRLGPFF